VHIHIYTYMHVCVFICNRQGGGRRPNTHTCPHQHPHTHTCIRMMHTYMHTHPQMHTYDTHIQTHTLPLEQAPRSAGVRQTYTPTHAYVCIYTHTCIQTHTHTCIRMVHTYMYTDTHLAEQANSRRGCVRLEESLLRQNQKLKSQCPWILPI
jgi:hypothetical protein